MTSTKTLSLGALLLTTALLVGCANNTSTEVNTNTTTTNSPTTVNTTTAGTNSSSSTNTTSTTTDDSALTIANVAKHSTTGNCWMIISENVYDVSDYVPQHPGGSRILSGCGKDATGLFNGTDPMGRMHSAIAKSMLNKYKLGALVK